MGVKVSHDDVAITEIENKVKVRCAIGETAGDKGM